MFSVRTPGDLTPNRLTGALAAARAAGRSIIDLTESNPTRAGFDYPTDLLRDLGNARGLVYAPSPFGLLETRAAVAREYERSGVLVAPERIVLTASTSEAYAFAFKLLADPGDEVLVPRPSYPLFEHLASLDGVSATPYDLDPARDWRIDFDSLDRALSTRTRAVLLVSPNNPTGSFVKADEIARLAAVAADRGLALIGDEVFADYELMPGARAASGSLLAADVLSLSLGGLSKSVGLPQVKLAWMAAAGPADLVAPALARLELIADTYLSVSTPVQVAIGDLLRRGAAIRAQIAYRVASNYRQFLARAFEVPGCRALPSEGGWYGVLEVAAPHGEEALVLDLLESEGVLVHPGYFYDFPAGSYLVMSLLVDETRFEEGLDRLLRHIAASVPAHE
jgi:alanine-synthesizing transaminase